MSAAVALLSFTCTPAPAWVNSAASPLTLSTLVASAVVAIPRWSRLSRRRTTSSNVIHPVVDRTRSSTSSATSRIWPRATGTRVHAPTSNRINDPAARPVQSAPDAPAGNRYIAPSTGEAGWAARVRVSAAHAMRPSSSDSASFIVTCFCAWAGGEVGQAPAGAWRRRSWDLLRPDPPAAWRSGWRGGRDAGTSAPLSPRAVRRRRGRWRGRKDPRDAPWRPRTPAAAAPRGRARAAQP